MARYAFDPLKHGKSFAEYDLSLFYFVVHEGKLMLFVKGGAV